MVASYHPKQALVALRSAPIDVVLIDSPRPGDPDIIDQLRMLNAALRVVAVGIRESASEILACAARGIDAYVRTDATVAEVVAAVENAARNKPPRSATVAATGRGTAGGDRPSDLMPLTARELQVADLMNRGLSNKEIARRLDVQPCTAKNHVRNILLKLGEHRRGRAVAKLRAMIGERFGIVRSSDP